MASPQQTTKAEHFRSLHRKGDPVVLVNAWDAATARLLASVGAPAIATSSAAMAWSLGRADGEGATVPGFVEAVERIVAAVDVPVTVDVEAGQGQTPGDVAATIRRVLHAGAVGVNLEDRVLPAATPAALYDIGDQQLRIRAARAAGELAGVELVINARIDTYLAEIGAPEGRLEETLRRAAAYTAAGADVIYVPAVRDAETIGALCAGIEAPLNVLAVPGSPPVSELAALGVARVSLGSWPMRSMLAQLQRAAQSVYGTGQYSAMEGAISMASATVLFAPGGPGGGAGGQQPTAPAPTTAQPS